jgi:sulfur-carrier protein
VQFYAQLRDFTRTQSADVELTNGAKVSDLLHELYQQFPTLRAQDKSILIGVGVEFVDRNHELKPGEEIAIMPPVQGG